MTISLLFWNYLFYAQLKHAHASSASQKTAACFCAPSSCAATSTCQFSISEETAVYWDLIHRQWSAHILTEQPNTFSNRTPLHRSMIPTKIENIHITLSPSWLLSANTFSLIRNHYYHRSVLSVNSYKCSAKYDFYLHLASLVHLCPRLSIM